MKTVILASLVLVACGEVQSQQPDATVDPCATATCECTIATQAADCAAHEVCDESGPGRVCGCAPAYADQSGSCVFVGGPLDKGFMDPTKWTALGTGSSVNAGAAGNLDPGEGQINRIGMCTGGGLKQTFTMPPFDRADAFKVSVTHTGVEANFDLGGAQVAVGVGGQFFESAVTPGQFKTDTFCLGPRAYGKPVDFQVGTFGGPNCGSSSSSTIHFDQLALQLATPAECPAPNTVVNGDFETGTTGWTFSPVQGATGTILGNIGEGGTSGARLTTANKCSEVTMTGTIALPDPVARPNQAIDIFWTGTNGSRLAFQLADRSVALLDANGKPRHSRICVPDWAAGTTASLGFFLQRISNNGCTVLVNKTFTIDNVTIVDDPGCAPELINDPGFERIVDGTGPVPGWGLSNGYVNDQEGSTAVIQNNPALAHTGNGVLRLGGANECVGVGQGGADVTFYVPPPTGAAGPALKFFANVGANHPKTTTRVAVQPFFNTSSSIDLPENGIYTQGTLCLPPNAGGRRVTVRFSTGDSDGGGCGANYTEEVAFIDDVEVTTDAACPVP